MAVFYQVILLSVMVLLAGNLLIGPGMSPSATSTFQSSHIPAAKAKETKRLFKQRCVKCHGSDGTGNTPDGQIAGATNLTDPEWQQRVDDKRLVTSIKHGRGQMPAFGEKLTEEQITSLVSYVRTLGK